MNSICLLKQYSYEFLVNEVDFRQVVLDRLCKIAPPIFIYCFCEFFSFCIGKDRHRSVEGKNCFISNCVFVVICKGLAYIEGTDSCNAFIKMLRKDNIDSFGMIMA